jgi:arylsulfatase A-like enzyme/Tfp pilus assembly protein PilF
VIVAVAVAAGVLVLRGRPRTEAEARKAVLRRSPAPADLNVVVVTLDTTRSDRLGCYGFRGVETPHIDALAGRGVLFEQATATVPLTFPSHASIFTGLLPPHHGVRDNGGFFLDDSKTTLAERLKAAGYATGAFIGAWVLEAKWGLAQGFDTYSDKFELSKYKVLSLGTVQKKGDEVMDEALAWLETVKSRKFFAWVHLYDPHAPYDPPEPFKSRYGKERYLGEIAYADQVVGRLTAWLEAQKLTGRTLVVLTADHGEGLGDHDESTHAYFIYDSTVHVPLIIATPWGDRGRSRAQVTSVDVMPTVLDLMGQAPQEGIDGRSLALAVLDPGAEAGHVAYSETYFPRYHFGWQHLRSLRDGRYKFIEAPEPELYDIAQDPGERSNIFKAYSKTAEELRVAMNSLVKESGKPAPEREKLDPDTLQRLAALGYVGNVSDVDPDAVLPDPKSKHRIFEMMGQAKDAAQEDRLEEAIATMRTVLSEEPQIVDAHLTLGNWLAKLRRPEEAAAEFKATLALKPDNEIAMVNLANLYRGQGKAEAALEGYKTALKLDPKSPQTWFQLATLYLDLGRVGEAEQTFRQAAEKNPKMGAAYNSLGVIAFSRGRMEEAEGLVRKGLELEPRVRTGRYNLARILEARGQGAAAEALYRAELETYPDHGRARFNLAQLLRERGDRAGYLGELQQGVEKAPEFGPCYFFLARERLGEGRFDEAADLARRGLEADASSEVAPLGHYVLADVYNRQGQHAKAEDEVGRARRLEAEMRKSPQRSL